MYTKQQASLIRKDFWTRFGQYMKPLPNGDGETVNWLNYKTGVKHIYFRMDADNKQASIAIELTHPDPVQREHHYNQFVQMKSVLTDITGAAWQWKKESTDENGGQLSEIKIELPGVNIFDSNDWPAIISFFKSYIINLDKFWLTVKDGFQ